MADLKPLEEFDARIVQTPLEGLLRNMDSELERRVRAAMPMQERMFERSLTLLLLMLRFTKNSYEAIRFLCATDDNITKRRKDFVMILPPANRQLLDLLFTLVYMIDDFPGRSAAYELASYRKAREDYDKFNKRFGADPAWQKKFTALNEWLPLMEVYFGITPEQKANPGKLPRWHAPYRRKREQPTKSQPFLDYLEKWLYDDTSAQAHLNGAGLFSIGPLLMHDFAPDDDKQKVPTYLEQYLFQHFCRTLIAVLGIATEIDTFAGLGNRGKLVEVWVLLGGYAREAADIYKERYQSLLAA